LALVSCRTASGAWCVFIKKGLCQGVMGT
jgi:hypothetical protein